MNARNEKPQITYPCQWEYRLIGRDARRLREAVAQIVLDAELTVADGNVSQSGKYVSVALTVTVRDEAHRDQLFQALRSHRDVVMVL